MKESDLCPVCGWSVIETDHIPRNPAPDQGPNAPGTYYVHRLEAIGNGRYERSGCSLYQNGEKSAWDPPAAATGDK